MLSTELLIVFCLGVLAVQAIPPLKNDPQLNDSIDDIVKELEDLNREVSSEQHQALDRLSEELRIVVESSDHILNDLGDDLRQEEATWLSHISALVDRAFELGVDIRECTGDSLDEIAELPDRMVAEAEECITLVHTQAELAVDEGVQKITEAVGPIDEYWQEVERCREADRHEQERCVAELSTQIKNDQIQIPANINLAVEEVVARLDDKQKLLPQCARGQAEKYDEEAGHIVRRATECAENKFPPIPTPLK